jgi:hypothetical protein
MPLKQLVVADDLPAGNDIQRTTLSVDVLGRFICNTFQEVAPVSADFDVVVIGSGMYGAYCAAKLYWESSPPRKPLRILVLEAGPFLLYEHGQNVPDLRLYAPGLVKPDSPEAQGTRNLVWGMGWRGNTEFPGTAYCVGGKSLYWGGWCPRLQPGDLDQWPADVRNYLVQPPDFGRQLPNRNAPPEVWSAVFGPDGKHALVGSDDHNARVFKSTGGDPVHVLRGHQGPVRSVAFGPDGKHMATASDDSTARVWDAATGAPSFVLAGHSGAVRSVAFSADGLKLVTAGGDGAMRVWTAPDGSLDKVVQAHSADVRDASFSMDGTLLVSASDDHTARVWNVADGTLVRELVGHAAPVRSAAFSTDGLAIVTASDDGTCRIWSAATGVAQHVLAAHGGAVRDAIFSPDGAQVATATDDGLVGIWDTATGSFTREVRGHAASVRSVVFSADGGEVLTASADGTARIWNVANGNLRVTLGTSVYEAVEFELGVKPADDFVFDPIDGPTEPPGRVGLNAALRARLQTAIDALNAQPNPTFLRQVDDPPIAVQTQSFVSGVFSPDKYSSVTLLIAAIRDAQAAAHDQDAQRRLFLVPNAHVSFDCVE